MTPEETINNAILDKPLHQLTEDDISQLTSEDCRRYLKDKGRGDHRGTNHRRSSKLSLSRRFSNRLPIPTPPLVAKSFTFPAPKSLRIVYLGEQQRIQKSLFQLMNRFPTRGKIQTLIILVIRPLVLLLIKNLFILGVANMSVEQMTIFYYGKVNVYDDVPPDKAQTIMQLAASPLLFPQEIPYDGTTEV